MTRLASLSAACRSDVIPGYVLSPPRLREWGDAEAEAARLFVAMARDSTDGLPSDVQVENMQRAMTRVAEGMFGMGMPALDAYLRSAMAAPFITWLSLRVKHPQLTRESAASLVTEDVEEDVARAALELWGFLPSSPKKKTPDPPDPSPLTGPTSSPPSEVSTDSDSTKS